jgi:nicotinate-nucleotide adenylyltransferase
LESLGADELIFVPARRSPHKDDLPLLGHHRLAMIRKAIKGIPGFSVTDYELNRSEPSYTLETVRFFAKQYENQAVLHWLVGADQLTDLGKWYRINELLQECRISVMVRAGYPQPDFSCFEGLFSSNCIEQLKKDVIQTPRIDLSSTEIRRQLSGGTINPDALPPAVLEYITEHCLYGYAK